MSDENFQQQLEHAQEGTLVFLRAFEIVQQTILFQDIAAAQGALDTATGDALLRASSAVERARPNADDTPTHEALRTALAHLALARETFLQPTAGMDFGASFLGSRGHQCQALEILYQARAELTLIDAFFRLSDDPGSQPEVQSNDGIVRGIQHCDAGVGHNNYSLYVPEHYDTQTEWPLIIALHGGYGRGDEYLWSWLRAARSRGYLVLSPKSIGPTWSILQPGIDGDSVMRMLDKVCEEYAIDKSRILLSGLSDGGTFSYLLALAHPQRFAAVSPIAGVLSPMTDPLLRAGHGKDLPMYVIHGALDAIFPVQTVRSTTDLMRSLGYQVKYTELPDWGHALTYTINEKMVLPWFEALH